MNYSEKIMENKKELIRDFLESFVSMLDNVAGIARQNGVFIDEIDELRDNLEYTKEKIEFNIHEVKHLPPDHSYFVENQLKLLNNILHIGPNYLWCFDKTGKNWVKLNRVFARKCDITGVGMNEGFCVQDGLMHIKNLDDLNNHIKNDTDYKTTSDAYDQGYYYYTSWEDDPLDYQYKVNEHDKLVEL